MASPSLSSLKPKGPAPAEVHVIWLPDGMSCDGDTISVTAAEQPSIEDLILGAIPGVPKVVLHNRVLAAEQGGEEFMSWLYKAERGELSPFLLVVEGSIPNEKIKREGYWTGIGNDPDGQPITLCEACAEGSRRGGCGDLCDIRRHSCDGRQPDRFDALGGLPWVGLAIIGRSAHRQCSRLPGAAGQHD